MKLKDIIPYSCFGTIGTIVDEESIGKLKYFLFINSDVLNSFKNIVVSLNYKEGINEDIIKEYKAIWSDFRPDSIILIDDRNEGHMFGTIELEERLLTWIKYNITCDFIWKSMDDVMLRKEIFEVDVNNSDFYYLPGFSYDSVNRAGGKERLHRIYENFNLGFWTPQTTFFIIRSGLINSFYGDDVVGKKQSYFKERLKNPYLKPWEMPFDIKFDCETHLGRTTKDMKKYCLAKDEFIKMLDFNDLYPITDPSHKNFYFKNIGICHYHFYNDPVYIFE